MSTINLEYGKNYHINKTQNGYVVTYVNKGKMYNQEIDNGVLKKPTVVDYCDEVVPLLDGCVIKRNREILFIYQE